MIHVLPNMRLALIKPIYLVCLHDQNKSGFFGGPAFFPPIKEFLENFKILWFGWKKAGPPKML